MVLKCIPFGTSILPGNNDVVFYFSKTDYRERLFYGVLLLDDSTLPTFEAPYNIAGRISR